MNNATIRRAALALGIVGLAAAANTVAQAPAKPAERTRSGCDAGNGGLKLPGGFCASVFAEGLGHARHLAVAENGDVYVNTWSSKYNDFTNAPGGFVVALRDADKDGKAETVERFGNVFQAGKPGGGTGIAVQRDVLFVEVEGRIARYVIGREALVPRGGEAIVTGMPLEGDHPMHTFAVSADGGSLYVNSGSASNACQEKNRELESPGKKPCPELPTRAGIWRFDAKKTGQTFTAASRFATGARNSVGLAVDSSGTLVAAIHGRDQLSSNWPKLYTQQQNNELPAETLVRVGQGDDFGWPYCYYDAKQAKLLLAPEYGGDGGKSQGECASKKAPDLAFPAHWAPEAIAFYGASAFPEKYRGGAFVTFHGSWDRKPVQSGFLVAFVPWAGGKPAGSYEEFATGFAGPQLPADPKKARYRPMGIAVSPDGALFVSDDVTGRIWRIVASGPV